jgi:hypothetical protein
LAAEYKKFVARVVTGVFDSEVALFLMGLRAHEE